MSRRWVFVINNYNEAQVAFLKEWKLPEYLLVGKEVGDSGTPHLQGFVCLRNNMTASSLQAHLTHKGAWPGAWHKAARGGCADNLKYCSKEHLLIERGAAPADEKAKGSGGGGGGGLEAYAADVRRGTRIHALWEAHSTVMMRHNGGCAAMRSHYAERQPKPPPKIFVAWGSTGTGKSRWAMDSFGRDPEETYWVTPGYGRLWWGGYDGQHTAIFDDFQPSMLPIEHFKLLCDRYAYRVEGKGTQMPFVSKIIVFTSNSDPATWYRDWTKEESVDEDWKAIQRRLKDCDAHFDGVQTHLPWRPIKPEVIDVDEE